MPYWRLAGFYFFYFAVLGALVPYWGLYLKSIGFTPVDIGSLMAVLMLSRIVAPNVWAYIADHRDDHARGHPGRFAADIRVGPASRRDGHRRSCGVRRPDQAGPFVDT